MSTVPPSVLPIIHIFPTEGLREIYSLILGTTVMIVLSSDQAVRDLVDRRSGIYSDRPDMHIMRLLSGGDNRVTFMPYGSDWRLIRKIYHNTLNAKAAKLYAPYQELESTQLLVGLLDFPDLYEDHIKRYTNSQTTQIVYGFRTTSIDDPKLKQFFRSFEEVMLAASGTAAALLDLYPILRRVPEVFLPASRRARELHRIEKRLYGGHWLAAKDKAQKGTLKVRIATYLQPINCPGPSIDGTTDTKRMEALFLRRSLQSSTGTWLLR